MSRWKYSIVPVIAALSALFLVLPTSSAGTEIGMRSFEYDPQVIQIHAGDTLTFVNESKATHTASCDGCPWDTGDVQPGARKSIRFDRTGDFTFFCRYHGLSEGMVGGVRVLPPGTPIEPLPTGPPEPPEPPPVVDERVGGEAVVPAP